MPMAFFIASIFVQNGTDAKSTGRDTGGETFAFDRGSEIDHHSARLILGAGGIRY